MSTEPPDPQQPPTTHEHPAPRVHAESLLIVHTGDGKGKSTAAFGMMLRALARGWRCSVIQSMKSEKWRTGEERMGRQLGADWWALGEGFTWETDDLEAMAETARHAWAAARERLTSGDWDFLVLDELTYPMNFGWIDRGDVTEALAARAAHTHVVVTGRDAPEDLCDLADTVTEMRKVRHAYDRGVLARRGVDF